jgi:hypothetical protein
MLRDVDGQGRPVVAHAGADESDAWDYQVRARQRAVGCLAFRERLVATYVERAIWLSG